MSKKVMVVGLGPEYNYITNNHSIWKQNNTRYASNHGASLISRTLMEYFGADYIDDLEHPEKYKDYSLCVLAFATHITSWRDVSVYTSFVKSLNIKTVAFSLGIQDYSSSSVKVHTLHPSMKELLEYILTKSKYIGVRGPHTASVLIKSGIKSKNIIKIGCPTMYSPLNRNMQIDKKKSFSKPLVVFHSTMAELNKKILSSATLLGQDFLDEVIFADIENENPMIEGELKKYGKRKNGKLTLEKIKENGYFPKTFKEWFVEIGNHDFVLGARLHGCIAALIQGIPAVMIARDIRVIEIAEFFKIPYIKYEDVKEMSIEDIYNFADYSEFNDLYKNRFDNFIKLMNDNDILESMSLNDIQKVPERYFFNQEDLSANDEIIFKEIAELQKDLSELSKNNGLKPKILQIPGARRLAQIVNKIR